MQTTDSIDCVTEPEIPLADPSAPDEVPLEHLARCVECGGTVRFFASAAGSSFSLATTETDQVYGIGPHGRPECPGGHGEMELADDQIPAAEAISEVARMQHPQQADLPGIVPPFNYQGAYLELESKAVEVDELHREYVDAAEEARDAKKGWDKAAELFTKMAIEFQRRRREKVAAGEPVADVDPTRCAFEQLHPDTTCPICEHEKDNVNLDYAPRDSSVHVEQAQERLDDRAIIALQDLLDESADIIVTAAIVKAWTPDERAEITAWVVATRDDVDLLPARPKALGTMHVAGTPTDANGQNSGQNCTQCDAVLIAADVDDDQHPPSYYDIGTLVGIDCLGKVPEPSHHYAPKRSAKAPGKKAAKGRKK